MVSVKGLLQFFSGILSFGMCFGKYFTLVPANTDKRSPSAPISLEAAETVLHCATLCDLFPSCYSFTFSKSVSTENCRLLSLSATSSAFTTSDPGNKHYKREIDCGKCSMNYTMAMDTSYDCQLQQEIPLPNGWAKGSIHSSSLVLNGNGQEFVATSSGCNTIQMFQCLEFYWYSNGPAMLKVTAGSGSNPTTYFSQTVPEGEDVHYELKRIDVAAFHSSLVRFVGFKTLTSGGGQYPIGIYLIRMVDCPCSCIT